MIPLKNHYSKIILFIFLALNPLFSQDPCDPSICCESQETFIEPALGDLPDKGVNPSFAYHTSYGSPQAEIISTGCNSPNGVRIYTEVPLVGISGNGLGYHTTTPSTPTFQAGKTYCITFNSAVISDFPTTVELKLKATNSTPVGFPCNGNCVEIATWNLDISCNNYTMTWTAPADYQDAVWSASAPDWQDGALPVLIDDVCIEEQVESESCKAEFSINDMGCNNYCLINQSCGENLFYVWDIYDQFFNNYGPLNTSDPCVQLPAGVYTVTLTVFSGDGCEDSFTQELIIETDPLEVSCGIGESITINADSECLHNHILSPPTYTGGYGTVSVFLTINGVSYPPGTTDVDLPAGVHTIEYVVKDDCELLECIYQVTIECEMTDKYDCPIDVLFIMDNSGSIGQLSFDAMTSSALSEITAISAVYSNVNFGVVHYSGVCGEDIWIEHDFSPASSISAINRSPLGIMDDLDKSLGAVVDALNGTPNAHIMSPITTLTRTTSSDLYIVIYTDAGPAASTACTDSAMTPYTNSNILKGAGFDANITLVHFIPTIPQVAEVSSAIASPGGNSLVIPDLNAADPQGQAVPRQYIPASFTNPNVDLLSTIPACEPCFDCDELVVTAQVMSEDSCCYSITAMNGIGSSIKKLEAEVISPDWIFNTSSLATGAGMTWYPGTSPTANKVCLTESSSTSIPSGTTTDILSYCFAEATPGATSPQTVVFRWFTEHIDPNGEPILELECADTIVTNCIPVVDEPCMVLTPMEPECDPDNSYIYNLNFTVTNNSPTAATHVSLNGLASGYQFGLCPSGSGVNSISLTIPGGALAPGNTSSNMCVRIISPVPVLSPTQICFNSGLYSFMGECCHAPEKVCVTLEPCCDPCDINPIVDNYDGGEAACCYSLGVDNKCDYKLLRKVRATVTTPGVQFGYHSLGTGAAPNWSMCGSSSTMLCVDYSGGAIPKGVHSNILDFCLDGIDDPSEIPQQVLIEYIGVNAMNQDTVFCSDTLTFECPMDDPKCLEVSDQQLVCVPDSNKYRYTFTVTNTSTIPFGATDLDAFIISPTGLQFTPTGGTWPFSPVLNTGNSATISTCIENINPTDPFPIAASDIVFGYRLRYNMGDTCCYESVLDTIVVPPCEPMADCCDEERLDMQLDNYINTLSISDCGACFGPVELDSCVGMNINWGDGTGDFYSMDSLTCKTYDSPGTYNVCVQWEVYPDLGIFPCYQKDTCINVVIENCPSDCMALTDLQVKNVACEAVDCYAAPFCNQWLIDEIGNTTCTGTFDPYFQKARHAGSPIIIKWQPTFEGESHTIYDCDGNIIQACQPTGGGGLSCTPDAGINVNTDLTDQINIWNCGDALPTLSTSCANNMSIDYCVKVTNLSATGHIANMLDLYTISPSGVTVTPTSTSISLVPSAMTTINFNVSGVVNPGDIINLGSRLSGLFNEEPWVCDDTLQLVAPDCPVSDCCQDEIDFNNLVNQGLQITDLGDCTYQVCANQFDDCHWFWTAAPDWGDGTTTLPTLTQSDSPNNCWTHTYSTNGSYTITLNVEEQAADGQACWNGQMTADVQPDCAMTEPCCQDENDFNNLVNQGLQITDLGDCTYQVCANQFDDCHWFWTAAPDWGDGTTTLPTLTQSDSPNNCWTHTYSTNGSYTITLNVEEQAADGQACWNGQMTTDVQADCDMNDPCCDGYTQDDLMIDVVSSLNGGGATQCEACVTGEFPDCVNWYMDWGDGSATIGTNTGAQTSCHTYDLNGFYTVCLTAYVLDENADTCIMAEHCIDIGIQDCASCCDVSDEEYDELFADMLDFDFETCDSICFYPDLETCDEIQIDFGDGSAIVSQSDDGDICHAYDADGVYKICVTLLRPDPDNPGMSCISRDSCFNIVIECNTEPDCCNDYTQAELDLDLANVLSSLSEVDCNYCIDIEFPECVTWQLQYGDTAVENGTGVDSGLYCHAYTSNGNYTISLIAEIIDENGDLCLSSTDNTEIEVSCIPPPISPCDPANWTIPNGLSPNGDLLNEELILKNIDDCTIHIEIYNRWGQMVYKQNNYTNQWRGQSLNDEDLPDGTYYAKIGTSSNRDGNIDKYIVKYIDLRRE